MRTRLIKKIHTNQDKNRYSDNEIDVFIYWALKSPFFYFVMIISNVVRSLKSDVRYKNKKNIIQYKYKKTKETFQFQEKRTINILTTAKEKIEKNNKK